MKRTSHNSVCGVKRFFNSVAVMHIDIDVEHPRVNSGKCQGLRTGTVRTNTPQKLENTENNIIDVAKPTGFSLLGVM